MEEVQAMSINDMRDAAMPTVRIYEGLHRRRELILAYLEKNGVPEGLFRDMKNPEKREATIKRRFHAMDHCASNMYWLYSSKRNCSVLRFADFCGSRFCPVCMRNDHKVRAAELRFKINKLPDDYKLVFWTFNGVSNVPLDQLRDAIKTYRQCISSVIRGKPGWHLFGDYKGYYLHMEVTRNKETNTYHPHFHVLIAYEKNNPFVDVFKVQAYTKRYMNERGFAGEGFCFYELVKRRRCDDTNAEFSVIETSGKVSHDDGSFELTKYLTKSDDFIEYQRVPGSADMVESFDIDSYLKLFAATAGLGCFQTNGCFKWTEEDKEEYRTIIQNANFI